ncbi:MAG: MBL fold metallo-hydrolase [Terrimicrobiaceae bacterium]|nr:MBL fold metallo-hydrolase [Terrimicrobiaceae bacterium]
MKIPLEDTAADVVGKASRGLGVEVAVDAENDVSLRAAAARLGLGADALVALARGHYSPADPGAIDGLAWFNTPFNDMTVNSFVVFDPETRAAAAFDTGTDCSDMLAMDVRIEQVFLTHVHGDHVFEFDRLVEKTRAKAWVSDREPFDGAQPFEDGREFRIGSLRVRTVRTSGHARGGVTYLIDGLSRPLAIVGDALFAGSMGGGMVSFEEALRTNRENLFTLPDDTVVCPGHGPLTTIGEEKKHNPFFAR